MAEEPFPYYEGMLEHEDDDERARCTAALSQLLELVHDHVAAGVELYPTWAGEPVGEPKGRLALSAANVRPERFFFVEGHLYTLQP